MKSWGLVVGVAFLLTGCSTPAPASSEDGGSFPDLDVQATKTTGVLHGFVVDQAIRPVAGVTIALNGRNGTATTSDRGTFAFDDLEPGTYFFTASLAGYTTVQQSADVVAGVSDPDLVRIQVASVPGPQPFVQAYSLNFFVDAAADMPSAPQVGWAKFVEVEPGSTVIQTEAVWTPRSPLAQVARFGVEGYRTATVFDGQKPVDQVHDHRSASPAILRINGTVDDATVTVLGFFINADASSGEGLVGALTQQSFDFYVHLFYNIVPRDDWSFVRDGEYPLPP